MKLPALLYLIAFPAFSHAEEKDGGDWEFLKSRLPKEENEFTTSKSPEKTNTFRFVPAALKFIDGAEKTSVFEGLPHHTWEPDSLKRELERTEETIIGDFPFYPQPEDFIEKDKAVLRELTTDAKGFTPYLYNFMCGGFHPDYAIRFTKREEHCYILICFGCGGARILHDGKVIHCHLAGEGWNKLLAPYHKRRPEKE